MKTKGLLIDDKKKEAVIEEEFQENKKLLLNELKKHKNSTGKFSSYSQSMKELSSWLQSEESK